MDSDETSPYLYTTRPTTNMTPAGGVGPPWGARRAMKDDWVTNMARISPTRDLKLWRSRKLIVVGPPSVDHRSAPEVLAPISVVSV